MQEKRVDDDHEKQAFYETGVMEDEMQTRPEDQRLPGDGADPADNNERNGGILRDILAEKEKDISADVGDQAERGDEQAPEVQAAAALEGGRAEHDQLDGIVVNKGCEGSEDKGDDGVITDVRKHMFRHGRTCSIDLGLTLKRPTKSQESSQGGLWGSRHPSGYLSTPCYGGYFVSFDSNRDRQSRQPLTKLLEPDRLTARLPERQIVWSLNLAYCLRLVRGCSGETRLSPCLKSSLGIRWVCEAADRFMIYN